MVLVCMCQLPFEGRKTLSRGHSSSCSFDGNSFLLPFLDPLNCDMSYLFKLTYEENAPLLWIVLCLAIRGCLVPQSAWLLHQSCPPFSHVLCLVLHMNSADPSSCLPISQPPQTSFTPLSLVPHQTPSLFMTEKQKRQHPAIHTFTCDFQSSCTSHMVESMATYQLGAPHLPSPLPFDWL